MTQNIQTNNNLFKRRREELNAFGYAQILFNHYCKSFISSEKNLESLSGMSALVTLMQVTADRQLMYNSPEDVSVPAHLMHDAESEVIVLCCDALNSSSLPRDQLNTAFLQ